VAEEDFHGEEEEVLADVVTSQLVLWRKEFRCGSRTWVWGLLPTGFAFTT